MNDLYLSPEDHRKLSALLRALGPAGNNHLLRAELERAIVVERAAIPPTVVVMGSRVEIEDLATGEVEAYTLVYPEQADVEEHRLSILAPVGTALIGYAEGQEISWPTPGGARRLKLRRVEQPAHAVPSSAPVYVPPYAPVPLR